MYIEPRYIVNVYLDTNILLDYIEGNFPSLNISIKYLADNSFVHLRSSHYVLFELVENRKARLFFEKTKKPDDIYKKGMIKRNWSNNGHDYFEFSNEIKEQITKDIIHLKDELNIDFDEHVLHEGLLHPSNEVCLNTKISKEDSLVTVSCMNPQQDEPSLEYCLILTHDRQYFKSFNDSVATISRILESRSIKAPKLLNVVQFPLNSAGGSIDLYNITSSTKVKELWNQVIQNSLKEMLKDAYIGKTYKFGTEGISAKCIFINAEESIGKALRTSDGLVCISKDLKQYKIISGDKDKPLTYWNMGKSVTLPITIEKNPYFSFYIGYLKNEDLKWLREKGNLVFYYDI